MLSILLERSPLVVAVTDYLHRKSGSVEQYRAVAFLVDGTHLHINEVWVDGELVKYAYYHLSPTNQIIRGWDNAPHHPEVETFPHHRHYSGRVEASEVRSFQDVMDYLEDAMSGK